VLTETGVFCVRPTFIFYFCAGSFVLIKADIRSRLDLRSPRRNKRVFKCLWKQNWPSHVDDIFFYFQKFFNCSSGSMPSFLHYNLVW